MSTKSKPKSTKTLSLSPSVKASLLAAEKTKNLPMGTISITPSASTSYTHSTVSSTKFVELVPFIACRVQPEDFEDALNSMYSQIYVPTVDGYLKHMKLVGGRHVRIKVDNLPTVKGKKAPPVIQESLNFLPAGKIPYEYFDQIVMFFREVVRLKKMEYEAHAWILWSKEKGYFISIPKQTVSKAAVSFAYDEDALPTGSVIVVDLHSHNSMGSFFSGTDNNNDKTGIYYSGVIGNLTPTNFTHVIRFNLHEQKMACTLDDIFEVKKNEVTIPSTWLDRVQVAVPPSASTAGYTGVASYKNRQGYKPHGGASQEVFPLGKGKWTAASSMKGPDQVIEPSFWDKIHSQIDKNPMDDYYDHLEFEYSRDRRKQGLKNLVEASEDNELSDIAEAHIAAINEERRLSRQIRTMGYAPGVELEKGWDDIANYIHHGAAGEGEEESLGLDRETDEPDDSEVHGPYYEEFSEEYGVDCAEAYDLIDSFMADLEGCDKGLLDIARQAYGLMTEKGRTEFETNGL